MQVTHIPAPKVIPAHDYTELGKYLAWAVNPQGMARMQALPEIYKQQAMLKTKNQMQSALLNRLESGGNGPFGDYNVTFDEYGNIKGYSQKSPKEKLENKRAQEDLNFYNQPSQPQTPTNQPPMALPPVVPMAAGGGQGGPVMGGGQGGAPNLPPNLPPSMQREIIQDLAKKQAAASIERESGLRQARTSASVISNSMKGLAQVFADATKEGATGSIYKEYGAKGILAGLVPESLGGAELQKGKKRAGAYPGKKAEVVIKMMPILTQQNDKPGSVRLVQTALKLLMNSLPELRHQPEVGIEMMTETLRNIYGFAIAVQKAGGANGIAEQMGYSPEALEGLSNKQLNDLMGAQKDELLGLSASLSPAQEAEINAVIGDAMSPLTKIIAEKNQVPSRVKGATMDKRSEYNKLRNQGVSAEAARKRVGL